MAKPKGMYYPLPTNLTPTGTRCIILQVPDDEQYMDLLRGSLLDLTKWYKYERNTAHDGKTVAANWWQTFDSLMECPPVIQFRQPDDCDLQVSFDGGATWSDIYNALACAIGAADNQIAEAIDGGILGGPTQPGPQPPPAPAECWTYHVTLQANAPWKIPIALNDGWVLTVSNTQGATYDGTFTPFWYCPDGGWFLLGACGGSPSTEGTDPLPTTDHMALIVGVGAVFAPMYNGSYTVPGGTGAVDGIFQVNDSVLSDNGGTIEFDLQVCSAGDVAFTYDSPYDHTNPITGNYGSSYTFRSVSNPGIDCSDNDLVLRFSPMTKVTINSYSGFGNPCEPGTNYVDGWNDGSGEQFETTLTHWAVGQTHDTTLLYLRSNPAFEVNITIAHT